MIPYLKTLSKKRFQTLLQILQKLPYFIHEFFLFPFPVDGQMYHYFLPRRGKMLSQKCSRLATMGFL